MNEKKNVKNIRDRYTEKEESKLDELKSLDREACRPCRIFSYSFGIFGILMLGIGMCLAMPEVVTGYMPLGIGIGLFGIFMMSLNYYIYKRFLAKRRNKFKDRILKLTDELLCEN